MYAYKHFHRKISANKQVIYGVHLTSSSWQGGGREERGRKGREKGKEEGQGRELNALVTHLDLPH